MYNLYIRNVNAGMYGITFLMGVLKKNLDLSNSLNIFLKYIKIYIPAFCFQILMRHHEVNFPRLIPNVNKMDTYTAVQT